MSMTIQANEIHGLSTNELDTVSGGTFSFGIDSPASTWEAMAPGRCISSTVAAPTSLAATARLSPSVQSRPQHRIMPQIGREPIGVTPSKPATIAHGAARQVALTLSDLSCVDRHRAGRLGALAAAEVIQHIGARPQVSLKELAQQNGLPV